MVRHNKMIKVYFDGACEPINPGGTASYGVIIFQGDKKIWEHSNIVKFMEGGEHKTSNNVAEYKGLIAALDFLMGKQLNIEEIIFYGDSSLVINQMFGEWKIKKGLYTRYAKEAKVLLRNMFPKAKGQWIPREKNNIADKLSKDILIKMGIKIKN